MVRSPDNSPLRPEKVGIVTEGMRRAAAGGDWNAPACVHAGGGRRLILGRLSVLLCRMKLLTALVVAAMGVMVSAQAVEFDVVSVKEIAPGDRRAFMVALGGRLSAATTVKLLIRTAYQIQDDQIAGAPDWLTTQRFEIDARSPADSGFYARLQGMMQALLADRFKLTTHTEQRELPVFALERVKRDGALGPGLRPTECPDIAIDIAKVTPCVNISPGVGSLRVRGAPVKQFIEYLSATLGRVVVDRTGLRERYDIDLKWTPEQPAPGATLPAADPDAVSIFTALQEQLGLRLDATRDKVDVLVIDRVERPTPN
jgi:uncharacterized protein (TIGR03435 family)